MSEWSSSLSVRSTSGLANCLTRRSLVRLPTTLALSLMLASCVRESTDIDGDGATDDAEEEGIELSGPPVLGPVIWAISIIAGTNEPETQVATVPVDAETLYAVFPVERLAAGTVLRAAWTFNGEPLEGLGAEIETPRDQIGGWLEFHLERTSSDLWPDGEYGITLTTDSILVATGEVQVVRGASG